MVDLGSYKDKFGESGQRILEHALSESRQRDQNFVSVEHILQALMHEEPDMFNRPCASFHSIRLSSRSPLISDSTPAASSMSAKGSEFLPTLPIFSSEQWNAHARRVARQSKRPTFFPRLQTMTAFSLRS